MVKSGINSDKSLTLLSSLKKLASSLVKPMKVYSQFFKRRGVNTQKLMLELDVTELPFSFQGCFAGLEIKGSVLPDKLKIRSSFVYSITEPTTK